MASTSRMPRVTVAFAGPDLPDLGTSWLLVSGVMARSATVCRLLLRLTSSLAWWRGIAF